MKSNMMFLLSAAAAVMSFAGLSAGAEIRTAEVLVDPKVRVALPPPRPSPWLVAEPNTEEMQIRLCRINAEVRGMFATVETELEFFNPNSRVLSGTLEFPLSDRAAVCGYALDIGGQMVDGVVVSKERARVAFETEVRRGIDPGLVEKAQGNVYRTRIYPLPGKGTRRIKLSYVTPLSASGSAAMLELPMPGQNIGRREVAISVVDVGGKPPELSGLGSAQFANAETVWRVSDVSENVKSDSCVKVAMPLLPPSFEVAEREPGGGIWRMTARRDVDAAPAMPESFSAKQIEHGVNVFWDASGGRSPGAAEFAALHEVMDSLPPDTLCRLYVFRNRRESALTFKSPRELESAVKAIELYDGGTAMDGLFDGVAKASLHLVFSDGLETMRGGAAPSAPAVATVAVCGDERGDFARLRRMSGGDGCMVRPIGDDAQIRRQVRMAIREALKPRAPADGAPGNFAQKFRIGDYVVEIREGGETAVAAREGSLLARMWASARIAELEADAEANREELMSLGRKYGLVSGVSSLIVLESAEQWARHKIEPPASLPEMREKYFVLLKRYARNDESRQEHIFEDVARRWKNRIAEWERDYSKNPYIPPAKKAIGADGATLMTRATANTARNVSAEQMDSTPMLMGDAPVAAMSAPRVAGGAAVPKSAGAAITVKKWNPETPYLKALGAAGKQDVEKVYLCERKEWMKSPAFYLDVAGWFFANGERETAIRVLSNLAEMRLDDPQVLRMMAWRMREAGELDDAVAQMRRVVAMRGEEVQGWRDLALVLSERGKARKCAKDFEEAIDLYFKVAFKNWDRAPVDMPLVALEELNALIAWIERTAWPESGKPVIPDFDARFRKNLESDLRIVMEWDIDSTDVDLHVLEPSGEEVFYGNRKSAKGGTITHDVTTGYGPEDYLIRAAEKGKYKVSAKYYASHSQGVFGAATVTATVYTDWGRANEKSQKLTLRLDKVKEKAEVGEVEWR